MAVKKYIVLIFIAFMLISYLYLSDKYNLNTIEYAFTGDLPYEQYEALRKSTKTLVKKGLTNKELICVVNYIGSYKGNRLIMTTGFDNLAKHIPMIKGNFINDNQVREAVLGDKAADRLFRSMSVVGQSISINKQEYKITGVIKNSDDIYISFDENSNINWSKKNIKFIVENQKYLVLYTEMLEGELRILDLEVLERVIYKQESYLYINIMIAMIVLLLIKAMKKQIDKTLSIFKVIFADYKEQSRTIEVINYLKKYIKNIIPIIKGLLLSTAYLTAVIKCISFLQVPPNIIPNNLFAFSSYRDTIKQNVYNYINRLDYGISGITLDIHIINFLILIAMAGALFYMNMGRQNKEKTHRFGV